MFIFLYNYFLTEINLSDLILFFFCNLILLNSIYSFFMRNPLYSLILLILNYSIVGIIFLYNGFIFLGLIFILIYVGAVSILLLFTLMLLNLKIIFYKSVGISQIKNVIYTIFFVEFISFFISFKTNKIFLFDNYSYINWFKILHVKPDFVNIGYELIVFNSELLLIIGLLLLIILVASVNIVSNLKDSKKQEKYSQLKNYNKNIIG